MSAPSTMREANSRGHDRDEQRDCRDQTDEPGAAVDRAALRIAVVHKGEAQQQHRRAEDQAAARAVMSIMRYMNTTDAKCRRSCAAKYAAAGIEISSIVALKLRYSK